MTKSKHPVVEMETTQGTITIALKPEVAPKAVENFLTLAQKDYYNGIIFHRIIKNFMLQGGDPTGTGRGGDDEGHATKVSSSCMGVIACQIEGDAQTGEVI